MKNYFILAVFIFITSSFAQNREVKKYNPLAYKSGFGFGGGVTYTFSDFKNAEFDYIANLMGDIYFPSTSNGVFGISGTGTFGYAAGTGRPTYRVAYPPLTEFRTQLIMFTGGLSYTYTYWNSVYPYAAAHIGWINYQPRDVDGNDLERNKQNRYSVNNWFANGELGIKFMVSEQVSLNIAGTLNYLPFDNFDDSPNSITGGSDNDMFFTFAGGIQFYFGGIEDSDNDGVSDDEDMCNDTPPYVKVDESGCPLDSDMDGIADYMDKCKDTPKYVVVDSNGCPLDIDNDGVPDFLDLCNDTPLGVKVDTRGCPSDTDEDGVPDYKDLCPGTTIGTEVNKWGCEVIEEVVEPIKQTEFVFSGGTNFEIGKSELLPSAYTEFEQVIKVMNDHPETKWEIEGHTDNTGSDKMNKELSFERARSVYNYFINNGINPNRLKIYGYGPDRPIADNNTETGRALNRRVAIVLMNSNMSVTEQKTEVNKDNKLYDSSKERSVGQMIFSDGNMYCVQVSSWRTSEKAENEAKRLQSKGFNSFIEIADIKELDGRWYRVRIGYFNSLNEANKIRERVK
ncbi:MAG: OmpA family protein [Ignavibacteriales bacterium]|nr:OmpA family protein [Ignavibacteriales bacterium]